MNQGIGIVTDMVIIVVMGMAVFYAVRLNRALNRARDGRAELIQLIGSLSEALARADMAVKTMKGTATEYELSLQKNMSTTKAMIEELSLINDTGNAIANRLERLAPMARAGVAEMSYETDLPMRNRQGALPPLRAERLGDAAKTVRPVAAAPAAPPAASNAPRAAEKTRSRAEQELSDALETLRKGKQS